MDKVFVYGSLKKGFHNHHWLRGAKCIGSATSLRPTYSMASFGTYPALYSGQHLVEGELYSVDREVLRKLDVLEGYPSFYTRQQQEFVDSHGVPHIAWVYILNQANTYTTLQSVEPNEQGRLEWTF